MRNAVNERAAIVLLHLLREERHRVWEPTVHRMRVQLHQHKGLAEAFKVLHLGEAEARRGCVQQDIREAELLARHDGGVDHGAVGTGTLDNGPALGVELSVLGEAVGAVRDEAVDRELLSRRGGADEALSEEAEDALVADCAPDVVPARADGVQQGTDACRWGSAERCAERTIRPSAASFFLSLGRSP